MNNKNSLLTRFLILCVAMLMAALPTMQASAALVRCRTDPIFQLSNGAKITIVLDISTDEASVLYANYALHVPADVTVDKVIYTAGGIGYLETYQVLQDSPANTYTTETLVLTRQSKVTVVVTTSLGNVARNAISGYSGQLLVVTVAENTSTSAKSATARK